ncbi:helix-turn-helix transcriptional regulator [Iodobacter fluviatilis]|uniref:AraC family transcriptional regulator n=1 Tax=Iodobacter fluviatilis TaxID=537 RepID=A0A377Q8M9_9NEIS|nr:helix-turn-helix transcriptional regulator [Iodobacter fluviatilis]TCU88838.1 AraC family transcriptional regulator [Iodobacter fluviatilis]STQ91090.1 Urease operon transcriptional activator [Iodobacter fluviatilis]
MSQLTSRSIQQCVIQAKATQSLRQVCFLQFTLMRVRHGAKHIYLNEQTQIARSGEIIIVPAGLEMSLSNQPDAHGYVCEVLQLDPQIMQACRRAYPKAVHALQTIDPKLCAKLNPTLTQLWDELFTASQHGEIIELLEHRAIGLLLGLALAGLGGALFVDRSSAVVTRVQQQVLFQPGKEWTVEEMAQHLQMGASTLRRQLGLEGSSFRKILEHVRLNTALGMIQTSRQPIGQIARQCGFASASRFSSRFHLHFGIKPLLLRASVM